MNIVEHKFNINLERRVTQSDIQITQGNHLLDKLIMNLLYQNEPVTIAGYDTVSVSFLRPDGTRTEPLQNAVIENTAEEIIRDPVNGTYQQGSKTKVKNVNSVTSGGASYIGGELMFYTKLIFIHPVTKERFETDYHYMTSDDPRHYKPVTKTGWGTATYSYPPEWDN